MASSRTSVLELVLELVQELQMAGSRTSVLELVLELVQELVLEIQNTNGRFLTEVQKLKFSNRPFVLLELILELFLQGEAEGSPIHDGKQ